MQMFTKHMDMAYLPWEGCESFDDFQNLLQACFPLNLHTVLQASYGAFRNRAETAVRGFFGDLKCSWANLEQLEAPFFWLVLCQWPPLSVCWHLTNGAAEILQPFWGLKPKRFIFNLRIRPHYLKRQHKQNCFISRKWSSFENIFWMSGLISHIQNLLILIPF